MVRAVANGQAVLHGSIIDNLTKTYHRMPSYQAVLLIGMEELVLKRMLKGFDETEIPESVRMTRDQIEPLVNSLCDKLGVEREEGVGRSP